MIAFFVKKIYSFVETLVGRLYFMLFVISLVIHFVEASRPVLVHVCSKTVLQVFAESCRPYRPCSVHFEIHY